MVVPLTEKALLLVVGDDPQGWLDTNHAGMLRKQVRLTLDIIDVEKLGLLGAWHKGVQNARLDMTIPYLTPVDGVEELLRH